MGCGTPWIWRGTPRIVHLLRKTTSHATSPPLRFGSVTGCRPIKKQKNKFFYVSKLPTKFVFRFFAWLVAFGNLCLTRWGWGWYTVQAVFGEVSEWFKEPVLKTGDSERGRGFESHLLRLWYFTILYILILFSWRSTQVAEGAPLERE